MLVATAAENITASSLEWSTCDAAIVRVRRDYPGPLVGGPIGGSGLVISLLDELDKMLLCS